MKVFTPHNPQLSITKLGHPKVLPNKVVTGLKQFVLNV